MGTNAFGLPDRFDRKTEMKYRAMKNRRKKCYSGLLMGLGTMFIGLLLGAMILVDFSPKISYPIGMFCGFGMGTMYIEVREWLDNNAEYDHFFLSLFLSCVLCPIGTFIFIFWVYEIFNELNEWNVYKEWHDKYAVIKY